VTKKEIVKAISEELGLTQLKTKEIVQRTFDAIVETLVEETARQIRAGDDDGTLGRIELRNFGVFEVKKRAARRARNPRTGERVDVREKFVVTFKPGKEMEERVRELQDIKQAVTDAAAERAAGRQPSSEGAEGEIQPPTAPSTPDLQPPTGPINTPPSSSPASNAPASNTPTSSPPASGAPASSPGARADEEAHSRPPSVAETFGNSSSYEGNPR